MEKEGLLRSLSVLERSGIKSSSIITARHPQIQKYLREQKPAVRHFYDVWHVAKGKIIPVLQVTILMLDMTCYTLQFLFVTLQLHCRCLKKLEALSEECDCGKVKKLATNYDQSHVLVCHHLCHRAGDCSKVVISVESYPGCPQPQ